MPSIAYDPSRAALYTSGDRDSLFLGRGYSRELAAVCAECARLAYVGFERDPNERARLIESLAAAGMKDFVEILDPESRQRMQAPALAVLAQSFGDGTDTQAYAATLPDGRALIAFRGTEPDKAQDLLVDAQALPLVPWPAGGQVHPGFARAYASVRADVDASLEANASGLPPVFTGHSLGAALATLAMSEHPGATLVTFGSPQVGDAAFAALVDPARNARHVDCCDLVTRLPSPLVPGYVHCGARLYIDRTGALRAGASDIDVDADVVAANIDYAPCELDPRNVRLRALADHAPINYIRAFT